MEQFKSYQELKDHLRNEGEDVVTAAALKALAKELLSDDLEFDGATPDDAIPDFDSDIEDDLETAMLLAIGAGKFCLIHLTCVA